MHAGPPAAHPSGVPALQTPSDPESALNCLHQPVITYSSMYTHVPTFEAQVIANDLS